MNLKKIIKCVVSILFIILLFIFQFKFINYLEYKEICERLLHQKIVLNIGNNINYNSLLAGSKFSSSDLEWSSDGNLIRFENGSFSCESAGNAKIYAKDNGKIIVDCSVKIIALSSILLESDYSELGEGLAQNIPVSFSGGYDADIQYYSENKTVASVDENGVITAVGSGETRIKICAYGCDSVYYGVKVSKSPSAIILSKHKLSMGVGEKHKLSASIPENEFNKMIPEFLSSDENVATVDKNGEITAVGIGSCKITASAYSGASASCDISVGKSPSSVSLSIGDDFLYAGETVKALVSVDAGAVCSEYSFISSDPSVAEISSDGVIKGKGRGATTIEVKTYNGKKDSCTVSVQIFDYMTPPTSQNIYDAVGYLAEYYPELISTEIIGSSVKSKDIVLLKLGKGNKKACVVAGLHAKENIAVAFTMRCVEEYAAAYYSSNGKFGSYNMKEMLDNYTLYIVPLMNPDGLDICNAGELPLYTDKLTETTRKKYKSNANGVNLNRNFPFRWNEIISSPKTPDEANYRGDKENSEPETQSIVKLVENNDFEWLFSMHCKGYFVYWADSYNKITDYDRKLANRLEKTCGFGLKSPSPIKNLGGGLENWFRYKTGNPGFCVELVEPKYSTEVNKYFSVKTNWSKTKYTFIQGMR